MAFNASVFLGLLREDSELNMKYIDKEPIYMQHPMSAYVIIVSGLSRQIDIVERKHEELMWSQGSLLVNHVWGIIFVDHVFH